MPQFTSRPPKDPRGYGLALLRTPANGRLILAVTSQEMIGCPTHWYGGRTVPCEGENCRPCSEGYPWRWHGYLSGILNQSRRHVLAEFTAQAGEQIVAYADKQGTLRGAILTSTRHRNRHNGRVLVDIKPGDLAQLNLPPAPDMQSALSIIWNLPRPAVDVPDRFDNVKRIRPQVPKSGNNNPPQIIKGISPHDLQ